MCTQKMSIGTSGVFPYGATQTFLSRMKWDGPTTGEVQLAKTYLSQPPEAPRDLTMHRYGIALLYEDAVDIAMSDPATAQMILCREVSKILNFHFIQAGKFVPRQKNLLKELAQFDPGTADLARCFYTATGFETRLDLAGEIADRTVGERGFFEWEASPEEFFK